MTDVLIFPFNGNGLEALDCLSAEHRFIGFVDDDTSKQGKSAQGFEVFSREALKKYPSACVLAVPGSPDSFLKRAGIISSLELPPSRFLNVIHASASISPYAELGKNILIMANVVITSNARIGDNVCILPGTVIHHDVSIGNFSLIGSNVVVAGYAEIGENCYIGSGSNIINNIKIGDRALVGLGTNVIKDIRPDSKVAGNPSRYL